MNLMIYPYKLYEKSRYQSELPRLLYGLVHNGGRYGPRMLFSCSGFECAYKFLCFLNSRQNSEKKEESKENDVQEEDINDSEAEHLRGLSISKIQEPKKNEISIKYLGLFILNQTYKVIIFVMFLFFIKYCFFNLINLLGISTPSLSMFQTEYINDIKFIDLFEHLLFIGHFFLFESQTYYTVDKLNDPTFSRHCILTFFWMVFNEFFFFILTIPIIFLFYKKNFNLIYIILCLFVLFSSFRVVLFVFLDQTKNFTTLYYYNTEFFGLLNLNPLFNYCFYLLGSFFGVLNYIVQKNPNISQKSFKTGRKLVDYFKYMNKSLMYILLSISIISMFVLFFFEQILFWIFALLLFLEENIFNYFSNKIINYYYLFDEILFIILIHFSLFLLYIKGNLLFARTFSFKGWGYISKLYFPFILYINLIITYICYKSEARIPLSLMHFYFFGMISSLLLSLIIVIHSIFFEIPLKRINHFLLH